MENQRAGLRCQDVHAGLRNVDPNSGSLVPLEKTRLVGMAGSVASLIRGRDILQNMDALKAVLAEQLDVSVYAFKDVIGLLEESGMVDGVGRTASGDITQFTESVPFYGDLYTQLGATWRERGPTQIDEEIVAVVEHLAGGPEAKDEIAQKLGLDEADLPHLLDVGQGSQLIKVAQSVDGEILYSPFYAFENPAAMDELVAKHGPGQIAEEFAQLRRYQGLPISLTETPALADAVSAGFLLAPGVLKPGGELQPFAALPYVLDREMLTIKKSLMEKALAVIACLRCGQHFGGYSSLTPQQMINAIDKLLDEDRGWLEPHSSSERQYQLLVAAGIIIYGPDTRPGGRWVTPQFVDTADNREAMQIARDLIMHGESMSDRVGVDTARGMLNQQGGLVAPMQTVAKYRSKQATNPKEFNKLVELTLGRTAR